MNSDETGSCSKSDIAAISTNWSDLRRAHRGSASEAIQARNRLVRRYHHAIHNYVAKLLKNPHDADEVTQNVIVRILEGGFAKVDARQGRFRDYLRVAVRRAVITFWHRKVSRVALPLLEHAVEGSDELAHDREWSMAWRDAILDATWQELKSYQATHPGNLYSTLLNLRVTQPNDSLKNLALHSPQLLGRRMTEPSLRKQLSRARKKFAALLLQEVGKTLVEPTTQSVEEELIQLGLLSYVRDLLPDNKSRRR